MPGSDLRAWMGKGHLRITDRIGPARMRGSRDDLYVSLRRRDQQLAVPTRGAVPDAVDLRPCAGVLHGARRLRGFGAAVALARSLVRVGDLHRGVSRYAGAGATVLGLL